VDRHNEVHLGEMVKTLWWEIEQASDRWKSVRDASHRRLRIEDIFLGHWWTRDILKQFFGIKPDHIFSWREV